MWRVILAILVYWVLLAPAVLRAAPHNPDEQARVAARWLASAPGDRGLSREDEGHVRFVTWYAVPPDRLEVTKRLAAWWWNQLSFAPAPAYFHDVPGSDGLVQWLDLRDFRWNADAWAAVAEREPYTQEPWVFRDVADGLRSVVGYHVPERLAKHDVFPVVGMVRGDWLLRETLESNRSTSYYDLLFAERRFANGDSKWRKEKRTVYHPGGDYRYPDDSDRVSRNVRAGNYEVELWYKTKGAATFVDFPKNKKQWDSAFGTDVVRKFGRDADVLTARGAVVAGNRSDPKAGSIVALNDRVVEVDQTPFGAFTTYDFLSTAGRKDPVELAPKLARLVAEQDVGEDGGEALSYLPNGGQAGFLFNDKGDRVEIANPQLANAALDAGKLQPGVRTMEDCIRCHAPGNGFNVPRNLAELAAGEGVNVKFKNPKDAEDFRGFFFAWSKRIKGYTDPYGDLLEATTRLQPPGAYELEAALKAKDDARLKVLTDRAAAAKASKGWTGAEVAKQVGAFTGWYDGPLSADAVALEVGAPKETVIALATESLGGRAAYLARGLDTPRQPFESDLFRELSLRVTASRDRKEK